MKRRSREANFNLATKIAARADRFETRTLWAGKMLDGNRIGIALWRMAHKAARRADFENASNLLNKQMFRFVI